MTGESVPSSDPSAKGEGPLSPVHAQLIRLHERLIKQLVSIRDELSAPTTRWLLREIQSQVGPASTEGIQGILEGLEGALRAAKVSESQARAALLGSSADDPQSVEPDLPLRLARFVADRRNLPGFTYTLEKDLVRGWIVYWKDSSRDGTVRGSGRYYERPYALLDEF